MVQGWTAHEIIAQELAAKAIGVVGQAHELLEHPLPFRWDGRNFAMQRRSSSSPWQSETPSSPWQSETPYIERMGCLRSLRWRQLPCIGDSMSPMIYEGKRHHRRHIGDK